MQLWKANFLLFCTAGELDLDEKLPDSSDKDADENDSNDAPLSFPLQDPFNRNLIRKSITPSKLHCNSVVHSVFITHPCPSLDKLKHWYSIEPGKEAFAYEEPPVGCDDVPLEARAINACFATSHGKCEKEYRFDLNNLGILGLVNDCKPPITFTDW